jgi:hypothetical protein
MDSERAGKPGREIYFWRMGKFCEPEKKETPHNFHKIGVGDCSSFDWRLADSSGVGSGIK